MCHSGSSELSSSPQESLAGEAPGSSQPQRSCLIPGFREVTSEEGREQGAGRGEQNDDISGNCQKEKGSSFLCPMALWGLLPQHLSCRSLPGPLGG